MRIDHPEVIELAMRLNIPECYVLGVLKALRQYAEMFFKAGDVTETSPEVLARGIRYPGDPMELWNALRDTGFLTGNDEDGPFCLDLDFLEGR